MKSKYIIALVLSLVLIAGIALTTIVMWFKPYKDYSDNEKFVLIPRGATTSEIAGQLEREGIIRHRVWFLGYMRVVQKSRPLQAGEYRFDEPISVAQVSHKLIYGLVFYHQITVPEGYSQFEILELLQQEGFANPATFRFAMAQTQLVSDLAPSLKDLEGFLFPDTYRFTRGANASEIVRTMVDRFRQVYYQELESAIKQSSLNLRQVITLASLIEKETAIDEERELVSAVFHNRLAKRIPLQCDPTVIYAARLKGNFRGEIYQSDLESKSPYNTYQNVGLPPGPIANPGVPSIKAALNPAKVNYLYFVSNNQGGHVFSATLDEHNRAVAVYRNGMRPGS
jgi:UPF0755 protein